ncbi:MAG: sterol-binding domain-containing protein [bacterium]|nr:MAG: sterol-binding domain-containing protein [bacterium]
MAENPKDFFNQVLQSKLEKNKDKIKELSCTYKFVITGDDGGVWRIHCKDEPSIEEGEGEADCTITMSDKNFVKMVSGKLNPQMAFMMRKLKVEGEMSLALKLGSFM